MPPRGFRWLFRNPFRRGGVALEVADEIAFHLDAKARDLEALGRGPEEARREALSQFGDPDRWRRETLAGSRKRVRTLDRREARDSLFRDLRAALRYIRRRPSLALLTVLVVALGIGTGTAVLAVLDAVLVRPLPFAEPDRVVSVDGRIPGGILGVSPANYFDWKEGQHSFSAMSAMRGSSATLHLGRPERVGALSVESDFFDVIGVEPSLGRRFIPEDDQPGAPRVAVLSHRLWVQSFGGDPAALGTEVRVGDGFVTVVGVMPRDFFYLDSPTRGGPRREIFLSDPFRGDRTSRTKGGYLWVSARLEPGISLALADRQLNEVAARLAEEYPGINAGEPPLGPLSVLVQPHLDDVVRLVRGDLLLVGGATTLLILAVCGNIAGLLLAWVLDRRRELAVRAALGANRLRLVRQVLAETGMLVLAGAAAGVLLAAVLIPTIQAFAPGDIPRLDAATLDARVLGGALVLALVVWLTSGLLPSVLGSRVDLLASLKDGARSSTPGRDWGGRLVIVAQVAIACALLSGAAILVESYARLLRAGSVADPQNVLALHVRLPRPQYAEEAGTLGQLADADYEWSNEAWREQLEGTPAYRVDAAALDFVRRVTERMEGVPGVRGVAFANYPPMWTGSQDGTSPAVAGADDPTPWWERGEGSGRKWVSPNFFEVLGLPLLRGRTFTDSDGPDAEPVVIVDQALVQRFFPDGADPLGRTVLFPDGGQYWGETRATIVGVVANTLNKRLGLADLANPILYVPLVQRAPLWSSDQVGWALRSTFIVRTERDPSLIAEDLREAIWAVDPELPLVSARSLADHRAELFAQPRSFLFILSSFAAVTLLLAAAGTVGLLARRVQQRTHEIGVRRALGATDRSVALRVIREGVVMAALGIAAGAAISFAVGKVLASRVVGVEGSAPALLLGVAALLLATAIAASSLPAWRASHVDPVEALRTE
jgi:ABC-type lipoprotein release transport system permease subunit